MLLAPVLARQRASDEAELSAVAAPDGTSIFFCASDDSPRPGGWLQDFVGLASTGSAESSGLGRIDHIGLAQPFDYFDEAALFYRSVLGLQPLQALELATPSGLVRSRAVTTADGSVRLALNVPLLAHDTRQPDGLQHVAFACDDIFAVARWMRARGFAPLSIPGNYYSDLVARWEVDPSLIAEMQDLSVLYDRGLGGEFLHFYTPTIGGRLFFEVVERRGGYPGFGAANAPIRMAAQRTTSTAPALRLDARATTEMSGMREERGSVSDTG
jgi:4-hydroxyphenylpyruvate dioxygenase